MSYPVSFKEDLSPYVQSIFNLDEFLKQNPGITSANLAQVLLNLPLGVVLSAQTTAGLTLPIPSSQPSPDLDNNNQRVQRASAPVFNSSISRHSPSLNNPDYMDDQSLDSNKKENDFLKTVKQEDDDLIILEGRPEKWLDRREIKNPGLALQKTDQNFEKLADLDLSDVAELVIDTSNLTTTTTTTSTTIKPQQAESKNPSLETNKKKKRKASHLEKVNKEKSKRKKRTVQNFEKTVEDLPDASKKEKSRWRVFFPTPNFTTTTTTTTSTTRQSLQSELENLSSEKTKKRNKRKSSPLNIVHKENSKRNKTIAQNSEKSADRDLLDAEEKEKSHHSKPHAPRKKWGKFEIRPNPESLNEDTSKRACKNRKNLMSDSNSLAPQPSLIRRSKRLETVGGAPSSTHSLALTSDLLKEETDKFVKDIKEKIQTSNKKEAINLIKSLESKDEGFINHITANDWEFLIDVLIPLCEIDQDQDSAKECALLCLEYYYKKVTKYPWSGNVRSGGTWAEKKEQGLFYCGNMLFELKELEKAKSCFQLLADKVKSDEALFRVALINDKQKNYKKAYKLYKKFSQTENLFQGSACNNLGVYLEKELVKVENLKNLSSAELAVRYYKKGTRTTSATADVYYNLGRLYSNNLDVFKNGLDLAIAAYKQGAEKFDDESCKVNFNRLLPEKHEEEEKQPNPSVENNLSLDEKDAAEMLFNLFGNKKNS
jgi:hypothetical protein